MMRFFEITDTNQQPKPLDNVSAAEPKDAVSEPKYATSQQQKPLIAKIQGILKQDFPMARVEGLTNKIIPHIRIRDAFPKQEAVDKLIDAGLKLSDKKDSKQISTSDTFQSTTYSLEDNGVLFTIVLAGKGKEGSAQVGIQMLRPEKFGLTGKTFTRSQLAAEVKSKIASVTKDTVLQQGLVQLVDVAIGSRSSVDPELMQHMKPVLNYVSQDFGEILTPLVMSENDSEAIVFPKQSNKPLIDVEVNNRPVAVKSLGGSGNSFAAIKDLINSYVETKRKEDPEFTPSKSFEILQDFVSSDGKTVDKLIRAAQRAKIPEAVELNRILNVSTPPTNYKQLEAAVTQLVNQLKSQGTDNLYKRYLETITPAAFSAGRLTKPREGRKSKKEFVAKPIPVGLPADYGKYIKVDSEADVGEATRSAGKKKFDQDFVKAASRQLTYMLGMGFRNHVVDGPASEEMESTITDVMSAKDAIAAKIIINADGSIEVNKIPFSDLKFGYQYHAGTSTVDQNAPGFHIYFT
jgi:hypothetical protein